MRIIYYSPHPTHDIVSEVGYATHQREVINALIKAGNEVIPVIMGGTEISNLNVLTTEAYKTPVYKKILKKLIPGFIWTTLNNHQLILHDRKAGIILENEIKSYRPDLIYERSEYLQDSGAKVASKYKIRYFLEVNAPFVEEMRMFEGYSLYQYKAHRIEKFKLQKANRIFSVSSSLSKFLINRYGCDPEKIILQPNCINPEKIKTDESLISDIRQKINNPRAKVIGFVGSIFPYHGVDILIEAFSFIFKDYPDTKLMVVGDGAVLKDLKNLTRKLGIEDAVIFTGKISHEKVFNYIKVMDICIMARSNWYGSPVKLFEYGLMNKPIIAPATDPVQDVLVHMEDALIIEDSIKELENAIRQLLDNNILALQMANHFHYKIISDYTWDKAAKKIMESCE